ncbi:hypothetical protein [Mucilaginibacter jinjuensis]|jgi:hypothetical protein|uniref:Uncharacterized protein n=1 Tax=Mucilaginibacter jinjuensis TaxID=1176721 RepID=A0ABY7TDT9_9SPHI|nr:hypothetical protein [Mucilaginibacter jinjuensis]WCT14537.1 hypothetical protein PQO05_11390 [Mucilaginibacter jinjuensis]
MKEQHKYKHMTLEITEQEYLIKLDRKKFGLSFIRSLLKQVEVAHPSEEEFFSPDRHIQPNQNHSSEPDYFGSIEEK